MSEMRELSDLIGRIYDGAVVPEAWPEIIREVSMWLGGTKGMLMTPFNPPHTGGFALPYGISQGDIELWATRYAAHDIWSLRAQEIGLIVEGNVASGDEYVQDKEYFASVLYREQLSRLDIAQVLTGVIFDKESPFVIPVVVSLYRGLHDPRFGEAEKQKLRLLVPHFSRAMGVMMRLRDAKFRVAASLAALDRINSGIVLFAAGGAVVFANPAAQRIFGEGDGLKLFQASGSQHLAAFDAETQAKLSDALAAALDRERIEVPHFARSVAVPRGSRALPYSIQFSALPAANEFGHGSTAPQAIAFITDCAAPLRTDTALLRLSFGLTPAEARAALALCDGGSVEVTAASLGVSANTLKTQLSGIYQKTGVDSRAKLVKLVLALAGADGVA